MRAAILCAALAASIGYIGCARADQSTLRSHEGESVRQALSELRKLGLHILYSSDLVTADLRVTRDLEAENLEEMARSILAPHGLALIRGPARRWLVVRAREERPSADDAALEEDAASPRTVAAAHEAPLAEITVTAGRYSLGAITGSQFLSKTQIARTPHIADDPLRVTRQLPGITGNDFAAGVNIRGGAFDETAILVDGMRIYDPFHLKDVQGALGVLDAGVIESIDVMTGGFGAEYGDEMSGIISMTTLAPAEERETTLGVSFVNAFARSQGPLADGRGHWLFSLRRGYLDWLFSLIDSDGDFTPRYWDAFGKLDWTIGDATVVTGSTLLARDELRYVSDGADIEGTFGTADSGYAWVTASTQWNRSLASDTVLSYSGIERERNNSAAREGSQASVRDHRKLRFAALRSDWRWEAGQNVLLKFGVEWRNSSVDYDYSLQSCFSDPYPSGPCVIDASRNALLDVSGNSYAAYVSTRWRAFDWAVAEIGLRGDRQSYDSSDDQLSPRVGLRFELSDRSTLRLGWGQYYQSQQPEDLLVEDGDTQFYLAERAEHLDVALEHTFTPTLALRAEAFDKRYRDLRPRYENLFDGFEVIPEAERDRIRVQPNRARIYGAELTLFTPATDGFTWRLGYAWMRSRDTFDTYSAPRSWDQTHTLTGALNWAVDGWNVSVFAIGHTGWPTTPISPRVSLGPSGAEIDYELGRRNSDRLSRYSRVDFRLSRTRRLQNGELSYFFELFNVFDRDNDRGFDDVFLYMDAGGNLRSESDYQSWLPRLPSFGFSWTFR
jgi:outer membrane cobalamin receptor